MKQCEHLPTPLCVRARNTPDQPAPAMPLCGQTVDRLGPSSPIESRGIGRQLAQRAPLQLTIAEVAASFCSRAAVLAFAWRMVMRCAGVFDVDLPSQG